MRVLNKALRVGRSFLNPIGPVILMYHRISKPGIDPWGLSVRPDHFSSQMEQLKLHGDVISLSVFVSRVLAGSLADNSVAVTFDDGYGDNFVTAAPILKKFDVPATIFLSANSVTSRRHFWWDELAHLIWQCGEVIGTLKINGKQFRLRLEAGAEASSVMWRAWSRATVPHEVAYMTLWTAMKDLNAESRADVLSELQTFCESQTKLKEEDLPLTAAQIRELATDGIEFGSHGLSHSNLRLLSSQAKYDEIVASKAACAQLCGREIRGFAFPFGEWDRECQDLLRAAKYDWALGTGGSKIRSERVDKYALPRVGALSVRGRSLLGVLQGTRC